MNLEKLTIRTVEVQDLAALAVLLAQLDGEAIAPLARITELFAELSNIPNYHHYLAYIDPNLPPVGCFSLMFIPTLMHDGVRIAVLDAVVVRQDLRGQGLGKRMMQEVYRLCSESKCRRIVLSSSLKRDRAHDFYRFLGFKQHGWSFSLEGFDYDASGDF